MVDVGQARGDEKDGWVVASRESEASSGLARGLGVPEAIARLLVCRGLETVEAAIKFLRPGLGQLHDPYLMLGMEAAVERLRGALELREPVLIYGDYDVDGTVATVLLKTAIERAGAAMGVGADVRYHIPHRIREGYGMTDARIEAAAAEGVRLVVSVDTGIRGFAAAEEAKRVGLDLIVTDHHLPDGVEGVPEALAVLNPNQVGCGYPYKELCGAGVAFKLAQALLESTAADEAERLKLREKTLPSFLKLLAIATIADAVPLTGENRAIAALGLVELRKPSQVGLRALMELAQIDTERPISATDVGFRLAPRINAAGRMDIASDVVEMFLTRDPAMARVLAEKLHRLNDERRASEAEALRAIEAQIEGLVEDAPTCLVLDDAECGAAWHRGVIGILASRVVDQTGRPALVVTHEDGQAYGSGRSVSGFHLLDALTAVDGEGKERLFARFGGHAHAVGFSLASAQVGELRERMVRYAAEHKDAGEVVEELACDAEVRLGEITAEFLAALEQMGPFGNGNSEPVFVSRGVRLAGALKVVKERHLRVMVEDAADGVRFGGMAWSRRTDWAVMAQEQGWERGDRMDVAYRLRRNWHPTYGGWELEIVGIRPARVSAA
ncbi:MAG: single-stranded-DNA-specific exonuclease RecJ [Acidobacteriaceae bacterium]